MTSTQWAYVFNYRVHGPQDTWLDTSGSAQSPEPLDELALRELVLGGRLLWADAMDNGWDRTNTVITRFHYTELPPVPVPDVSPGTGTVSLDKDTERQDSDGV